MCSRKCDCGKLAVALHLGRWLCSKCLRAMIDGIGGG